LQGRINCRIFADLKNKAEHMSRICELTGKKAITGNHVSFSNKKNKRRFNVNLTKKRFYLPDENKWVTLRVSTSALKNINKRGITAVIKEARQKGYLNK
jgi:large subunit ribosomal protein L28